MQIKRPVFLLAGGRGRTRPVPDPLIQAVYRESGKVAPSIAYVGTANEDGSDFFNRMAGYFEENGASKVSHALLTAPRASIEKAKAILRAADIIFVSGGDVERGIQILESKDMISFLQDLHTGGKPFFGVSAGSIMLAREWVTWPDPNDNDSAHLFSCLNIAPVICDTHDEEDDFGELQTALQLENDGTKGYGIVSGAAIKVYPDGNVEALGGNTYQYLKRGDKVERIVDIIPTAVSIR